MPPLPVDAALVTGVAVELDRLVGPDRRIGLAVSGGPDSIALLLLAAAARPGVIEAATVDHGIRPESAKEAAEVGELCSAMAIPHAILAPDWAEPPATAVQEKARAARYDALARWARARDLTAIATAHHADDQAETVLMRLARGAGVKGLAAIRAKGLVPANAPLLLIRPLLAWRKVELQRICAACAVAVVSDPTNENPAFERACVRRAMAADLDLDPVAIARSAANLAMADEALDWATDREWESAVHRSDSEIYYQPSAPTEVRRRVVKRILELLGSEGEFEPRGSKVQLLLGELEAGRTATLSGVRCCGGVAWSFRRAPPRRS